MKFINIGLICISLILTSCGAPAGKKVTVDINKDILKDIKSTNTIIYLKQNKLYADFSGKTTNMNDYGIMGLLVGGVLDDNENSKQLKKAERDFSRIRRNVQNYSFDNNFIKSIEGKLGKVKWLHNKGVNKIFLVDKEREKSSVLSIFTQDNREINLSYLNESKSDILLVIDLNYKMSQYFNEYVVDATVYLYALKDSLKSRVKKDVYYDEETEIATDRKILYKNNIRYSYLIYGLSSKSQASKIWSDKRGPHYIKKIMDSSIKSVSRLIAYDLQQLGKGKKSNFKGKLISNYSQLFGNVTGIKIGANKTQEIIRSTSGALYTFVDAAKIEEYKSRKRYSNKNPVIYIYRPGNFGSSYDTYIKIDGKDAGSIPPDSCLKYEVKSGKHIIKIDDDKEQVISINAQLGREYYIKENLSLGMTRPNVKPIRVSTTVGKAAITSCRRGRIR